MRDRRVAIVENIRDNTEAGLRYRADIEINEQSRRAIQARIDSAIQKGRSPSFLRILSQYRLMGVSNMELHFQLAIRDQIISDQREAGLSIHTHTHTHTHTHVFAQLKG